jgi:hypothetical protein
MFFLFIDKLQIDWFLFDQTPISLSIHMIC